jgi:hypothetical protein
MFATCVHDENQEKAVRSIKNVNDRKILSGFINIISVSKIINNKSTHNVLKYCLGDYHIKHTNLLHSINFCGFAPLPPLMLR